MEVKASEYSKAFADFRRLSDDDIKILSWLEENMVDILKEAMANTAKLRTESEMPFRSLSVGCGTGDKDEVIIAKTLLCSTDISYTAIDPDHLHLEQFKKNVRNDREEDVSMEIHKMSVEEFQDFFHSNAVLPYHFVSSLHSIYFYKDPTSTIKFLYEKCLQPGGTMVFMVVCPDAGHGLLAKEFAQDLKELTSGRCQFADIMDETLSRFKYPYEVQSYAAEVDVTMCFEDTDEGNRLLDFLCVAQNVRHNGTECYGRILQRMSELSTEVDGRRIMKYTNNVYIIEKPN